MLDKIREQRDRWQQRAEQLAAFSITDQRKEVFLVFGAVRSARFLNVPLSGG
jgi:hypothetical protein